MRRHCAHFSLILGALVAFAIGGAGALSAQVKPIDKKKIEELLRKLPKKDDSSKDAKGDTKAEGDGGPEMTTGQRLPLEEVPAEKKGDTKIVEVLEWIKRGSKEVDDATVAKIEEIIKLLDNKDGAIRETATQDLLVLGSNAARTLWRKRLEGSIERRARIDLILRELIEGEPYHSILARAARISTASLRQAISASAADFELLINRIAYAEIARFPRLWALLLISAKSEIQANLILERYSAYAKAPVIDLYFAIAEFYATSENKFVSALFKEVASAADSEDLMRMCEHSIVRASHYRDDLLAQLRAVTPTADFFEMYQNATTHVRKAVILAAIDLKGADRERPRWAKIYGEQGPEIRPEFIDMIMRERVGEAVDEVIHATPDAKEVPELLTVLGSRETWQHAFGASTTRASRHALMQWLPYSALGVGDQLQVLLGFLDASDNPATAEAAAHMLRGYGSPRLIKELLTRWRAGAHSSVLASLIAWHAAFLKAEVPTLLRDPLVQEVFAALGPLSRIELLRECDADAAFDRLKEIALSPIIEVRNDALRVLKERQLGLSGRVMAALDLFAPPGAFVDGVSTKENIGLLLLRAEPENDATVVGWLREYDESLARQDGSVGDYLAANEFLKPLQGVWRTFGLKSLLFALSMGEGSAFADFLDLEPASIPDAITYRSVMSDPRAAELRGVLAKNRPLQVVLNARLYNQVSAQGTVLDALTRLAEMRATDSIPADTPNNEVLVAIAQAALAASQSQRLPEVLMALNRASHRPSLLAILRGVSIAGTSAEINEVLDASVRRMGVTIVRHEAFRAAIVTRQTTKAWIDKMRVVYEGSLGREGTALLNGIQALLTSADGTPAQERTALATTTASSREAVIRGLALRGNLAALNTALFGVLDDAKTAQAAREGGESSDFYLAPIAHLFAEITPGKAPEAEYRQWYRSRYIWHFDQAAKLYRRKES